MSSFVVEKKEFGKAAGLLYGIEESKHCPHRWYLDNLYKQFVTCYEYNVKSVNEQYDTDFEPEAEAYTETFRAYQRKGQKIYFGMGGGDVKDLQQLRIKLMQFFEGVLYQIENYEMHEKVAAFFYGCVAHMYADVVFADEDTWWDEIGI